LHVIDNSVSQDQQNEVLLISSINFLLLSHIRHQLNNRGEMSRPVQIHIFQGVLVNVDDSLQAVHFRVENISVQREAVRRTAVESGGNLTTEAVDGELLV